MISSANSFLLSQASIESCSVINFQDCKYTPFNIYKVWSISFAKKFEVLEEVSALKFFLSSLYSYWIIFQISSCQSDLFSNCIWAFSRSISAPFVTARKISKWFQTWSKKVSFRRFKNDQKKRDIKYFMYEGFLRSVLTLNYMRDTWSMSSLWGLCQRLLDKCPNFCHFLILLYNFVYKVQVHRKLTGKHTSWTLANIWFQQFSIFSTIFGVFMVFSCSDMS